MIYAICSGEYGDFTVNYTFTDKAKRDRVLNLLNEGQKIERFYLEEFELCDNKFDLDKVETVYYAEYSPFYETVELFKGNTLQLKINEGNNNFRVLTDTELEMPVDTLKEKLIKEFKERGVKHG